MPKICYAFNILTLFFGSWRVNFILSRGVDSKHLLGGVHHVFVHILSVAYVDVSECLSVMVSHTQSCPNVVKVHWQFFVQMTFVLLLLLN